MLLSLACALLGLHFILNAAFPSSSESISYFFFTFFSMAAFLVSWRRSFRCAPGMRRSWTLFSAGLLLWLLATVMAALSHFFTHASPQSATLDDFSYFFYGVPILLAIASSEEGALLPLFFWLDGIQAMAAGYLAYIAIFEVLPFSGEPLKPLSLARLIWIYDAENLILAVFAVARLLVSAKGTPERRFFQILAGFLWTYAISAAIYNHIVVVQTDAGLVDVLVDLPFLFLALAGLLASIPGRSPTHPGLRKPLALFIDNARPLAFGLAIVALSSAIARRHLETSIVAVLGAFALYGVRSAMLQSRYLQAQQSLEQAMRRLSDLALQDGLTGVANRRCFDQRFQVEWQRSHRSQIPLSLLLIDIDHFKKLNDTHGHLAGDECLVQVARALRKAVSRPGDLLARYGGEEFVALLPETDAEGARNVALHMKALLDGAEPGAALCYPLTVSIGVATRQPPRAGSAALLLETADRAMYRAKQNGRNRIEVLPMRPPGSE
jgi:diguanylate cyclase (GGDEF)-like protein